MKCNLLATLVIISVSSGFIVCSYLPEARQYNSQQYNRQSSGLVSENPFGALAQFVPLFAPVIAVGVLISALYGLKESKDLGEDVEKLEKDIEQLAEDVESGEGNMDLLQLHQRAITIPGSNQLILQCKVNRQGQTAPDIEYYDAQGDLQGLDDNMFEFGIVKEGTRTTATIVSRERINNERLLRKFACKLGEEQRDFVQVTQLPDPTLPVKLSLDQSIAIWPHTDAGNFALNLALTCTSSADTHPAIYTDGVEVMHDGQIAGVAGQNNFQVSSHQINDRTVVVTLKKLMDLGDAALTREFYCEDNQNNIEIFEKYDAMFPHF